MASIPTPAARTALEPFRSGPPRVTLTNAFAAPFDNAVATARTCYSASGIVTAEQVAGSGLAPEKQARARIRRDALAASLYQAGHHTTLQHAHFQFALERVSRQCVWSFLHSHPFYNSEQVSQRYVSVAPDAVVVPPLAGPALQVYETCVRAQMAAYERLTDALRGPVEAAYFARFPARRAVPEKYRRAVEKRAQEVARYVLPVATTAYLYHTISGITLLRYWRLCQQYDVPHETRLLVGAMVQAVLAHDPGYETVLQDPLPIEATPEHALFVAHGEARKASAVRAVAERFDARLEGRCSKLVACTNGAPALVAEAAREVLGLAPGDLDDASALARVLGAEANPLYGEPLNLCTHSKLARAAFHAHYTFKKKLSHTADSQDQRHRLTPASRPMLLAVTHDEPDYVTPALIAADAGAARLFAASMQQTWDARQRLRQLGASDEYASYLLPNALAIRFTESGDLLALRHKMAMRLCYNAQEEIFRATLDEAEQIRNVHPLLGRYLLPPCRHRFAARSRPFCPEGERYCGVPVWNLDIEDYAESRGVL